MKQKSVIKTVCDGRFVCLRILGCGGEGTVYLAQDTVELRLAALKEYPLHDGTAKRIEKEALRLKGLSHKGIPSFYALFRENGCQYLAMEYIDGKSVKHLLEKKGPPGEKEALRIASALCTLLHYLHSRTPAVYYPDLKPSNILLDRTGAVYLVDFGAECAHTRGYAAPEQYLADAAPDARTDLYALGVTMHYLLTGKNPNHPPFAFEKVNKLNPKITKETAAVVERLLQPSTKKRWQSAREVEKAIAGIRHRRMRQLAFRAALAAAACVTLFIGTGRLESNARISIQKNPAEAHVKSVSHGADVTESIVSKTIFQNAEKMHLSFSLPDGSYETYQFLTISYDPLYGNLYYTTDGTEPGKDSLPYQDGIVLSAPSQTIRVCQLGLDGERAEITGDYKITAAVEEIPISPDSPLMWDIYYTLGKSWTEPVFNYELAKIRTLPADEIKEDDQWLLDYMPFLKN